MASKKTSSPSVPVVVAPLDPEIYTAACMFMAEVAEYNHSYLLARREFRLIEEHLENGTIPERLYRLQNQQSFIDWLDINRLFWPEDWSEDFAHNIEFIVERLRSEYLEDIYKTSEGLCQFKKKARQFMKERIPEQSSEALSLFNAYCRVADSKAAVKPRRKRWNKSRSN